MGKKKNNNNEAKKRNELEDGINILQILLIEKFLDGKNGRCLRNDRDMRKTVLLSNRVVVERSTLWRFSWQVCRHTPMEILMLRVTIRIIM